MITLTDPPAGIISGEEHAVDDFTLSAMIETPMEEADAHVRAALAAAGFGIITEIDLQATFRAKLDLESPARRILGACRPELAYRALSADARIAAMLPCNVVVAEESPGRCRVEAFDPAAMTSFSDAPGVREVATEARLLLLEAFDLMTDHPEDPR